MKTIDFNQEVWNHAKYLHSFAMRFTHDLEDANDLFQDTMLKALRYRDLFKEGTNLKGWLGTIMKNTFINDYRAKKGKLKVFSTEECVSDVKIMASDIKNDSVKKFILRDIKLALDSLDENYRIAFIRHFEGYKYEEIAQHFDIPIGTVKTWIHIARKRLKERLHMYQ